MWACFEVWWQWLDCDFGSVVPNFGVAILKCDCTWGVAVPRWDFIQGLDLELVLPGRGFS